MPWARVGDTAANHPTALAVLEHQLADERIVNELFGFVMRCSTQSAAHLTDYVINRGTAIQMAGGMQRANELLMLAVYAGYMVEQTTTDEDGSQRVGYRILDDPDFIHLRTKAEIDWEKQRRNDTARPELVIPVRLRDGDACRYCLKVVRWGAQNGRLGATYDHRTPGKQATSENDLVVSCRACNSGRKDNPNADQDYPLQAAPERAYFSEGTVLWLRDHDYVKRMGIKVPEPSGKQLQPGDDTGNGTTGPTTPGNGSTGQHEGNGTTGPAAPDCQHIANPAKHLTDGTGIHGTGRDGSGRDGKGREPSSAQAPSKPSAQSSRRPRRGRPRSRGRN